VLGVIQHPKLSAAGMPRLRTPRSLGQPSNRGGSKVWASPPSPSGDNDANIVSACPDQTAPQSARRQAPPFCDLGPRRAERASQAQYPAPQSARRHPKCLLRLLPKFLLSNCRDRNLQTFTRFPERIAKEFPFRRMNQRVRRENPRQRRQRAARRQEDSRTSDAVLSRF